MPKKRSKTSMHREADRLFSKMIRSIGYCQAAGIAPNECGGVLQACHVEGRRNHRLRWEPLNCLAMCMGHHYYFTTHPIAWAEFIRENFPDHYAFVTAHRHEMWDREIEAVLDRLKAQTA